MAFADSYITFFRRFLPTPFTIALGLTLLSFILVFGFSYSADEIGLGEYSLNLIEYWYDGLWNPGLLAFTVQMMLILVLGHALALSKPVDWLIGKSLILVRNGASAAALVAILTLMVAWLNWGLGLIFGAVLARRVGAFAKDRGIPINYPLIAAAGYSGLMIWHGGLSGSAPLTVAGTGHSLESSMGVIPGTATILSKSNLLVTALLFAVIPAGLFLLARKLPVSAMAVHRFETHEFKDGALELIGAEKIEHAQWTSKLTGLIILLVFIYIAWFRNGSFDLNLNVINTALLGLGLFFHRSIWSFLLSIDEAIKGAAGILIQFPLYFGILGLLAGSGLIGMIADFFARSAGPDSLPLLSFFSAGLVNIFVPSGGGQWAVQGPIIAETAKQLQVPMHKMIMAFSYGDQWTNMLQPFWALPLLAITGLKAKDILPYTLFIMLLGALVFVPALLFF